MFSGRRYSCADCRVWFAAALSAAFFVSPAQAADSCGTWQRLANGQWFIACVDDRGRNVCYTCPTKKISNACTKREGPACAA